MTIGGPVGHKRRRHGGEEYVPERDGNLYEWVLEKALEVRQDENRGEVSEEEASHFRRL